MKAASPAIWQGVPECLSHIALDIFAEPEFLHLLQRFRPLVRHTEMVDEAGSEHDAAAFHKMPHQQVGSPPGGSPFMVLPISC